MSKRKFVYWNKKQKAFLQARQPRKFFMAGRGGGKTTVDAGEQAKRAHYMPRSGSFLIAATYNQLLTKTLPTIEAKLKEFGWKENLHYVIGKKPPKHFETPIRAPRKHENVLSTVSGYYVECISMDNPQTARGGSYQSGSVDEALNLKQEDYSQIIVPSIRTAGSDHFFKGKPCFKQVCFYTSIPRKISGDWLFNYEKWAESDPENFYWIEATSWDNVDILGEDTLKMWEKEMPYIEYQIEVMNRRLKVVESAFYHKFSRDLHCYAPRFLYDVGERGWETKSVIDPHYKDDELLEWTLDFGGWINTSLVIQERNAYDYIQKYLWVKDETGKIEELVDMFCDTYKNHKQKVVRLWGERMGIAKNAIIKGNTFDYIASLIRARGWTVIIKAKIDNTRDHKARGTYINDGLNENEGRSKYMPRVRVNEEDCKDFIVALETANTMPDGSKDKSKEKDRAFAQEFATHSTDAFDYYRLQKYGKRVFGHSSTGGTVHFG